MSFASIGGSIGVCKDGIDMHILVPFIADIVARLGSGARQHFYVRSSVWVDIPEYAIEELPRAVSWSAAASSLDDGMRTTFWIDGHHWAATPFGMVGILLGINPALSTGARILPNPEDRLEGLGSIQSLHADAPAKERQRKNIAPLHHPRPDFKKIAFDNTDEMKARAETWALSNLAVCGQNLMIRVPEPHFVIGRNIRAGVFGSPRITLGTPQGFTRRKEFDFEYLIPLDRADIAVAVYDRIVSAGFHHGQAGAAHLPRFCIEESASISHPWHLVSALDGLDLIVESMRPSLVRMNTDDIRSWIGLARIRDAGFSDETEAEEALFAADRLKVHMDRRAFLIPEIRETFLMQVYGTEPAAKLVPGGPRP